MKILVTGAAGFIGMFTCLNLLARGDTVIGIDNLNDYYDVALKSSRLQQLGMHAGFRFEHLDIIQAAALSALIAREQPERIVHLAAQAGVRYSLKSPQAYVDANITGFLNLLEAIRHHGCD
ncbi:MAG: GDP-mannose 4,6-dehydratase, partial [Gammaproteobacteria bacterium]